MNVGIFCPHSISKEMEILSKLFGSSARVKILRLFLLNQDKTYEIKDIASRSKVSITTARKELSMMEQIGFIKRKTFYKNISRKIRNNHLISKRHVAGWVLDEKFPYLKSIYQFLINSTQLKSKEVEYRLQKAGAIKLVIVSGVFIQNWDSRIDILIVGDKLKKQYLDKAIKSIEAELGKELRYAVFTTADFKYRFNIYDKLIRDVLDYPHEVIVDKMGLI